MRALLRRAGVAGVVLAGLSTAHGQATVTGLGPATAGPGSTTPLEFHGTGLSDGLRAVVAWPSTFDGRIEAEASSTAMAVGSLEVPARVIGPVEVWPVTAAGPTTPRTIVIDDLPAVVANNANHTLATAQVVAIPTCIDGTLVPGTAAYFRFRAAAGQRVAIEALTRQLGSTVDPVVRLLDASGRVRMTSDDGTAGPEARVCHVVTAAGDYVLELHANAHDGNGAYHLRIGDFPILSHAMPLAVQRGTTATVAFEGRDAAAVPPVEVRVPEASYQRGRFLAATLPGGRSSAWVPLLVHEAPQVAEPSVNGPLPIPVGVSGSLATPRERDTYRVAGRAGQTIRIVTRGRSLGCGTVPRLRLVDAAGKVVAATPTSVNDKDPTAVLNLEPEVAFSVATDGEYRLEVDDLARRGGPGFGYFFAIEPTGVAVEVKPDGGSRYAFAVEPGQGCAPIDLVVRRFGHEGAISLALADPPAGLRLVNPVIPARATQARVYVAAEPGWTPRSLGIVRLTAQAGGQSPTPVSTAAVRAAHDPARALSPPVGDGALMLAGVPEGTPRVALVPAAPIPLARDAAKHEFTLALRRLDPAFKGPVAIDGCLLPEGFAATSVMDGDTVRVSLSGTAVPGTEPTLLRFLALSSIEQRTAVTSLDVPVTWVDSPPVSPPATRPLAALERMPAFAATYPAVIAGLKPRLVALTPQAARLATSGAVQVSEAGAAAFTGGRLDGVGMPLGDAWTVSLWFMNDVPVNARPVTGYLFSRGVDGDQDAGDHLGIGGSYQPELPGKLLVFNGNARNSLVVGRTALQPKAWHHLVMIRDGKRVRVYLDGGPEPEIDGDLEPTAAGRGGFFFGARADNFAPLQGAMANLAVFDRPLTAADAMTLFTAAQQRADIPRPTGAKNGDPQPLAAIAEPPPAAIAEPSRAAITEPSQDGSPAATPAVAMPFGPGLHVVPPQITLDGLRDRQQLAITSVDDAGFPCDWTRRARITLADPGIATLRGSAVVPVADGTTEAVVEADGRRQTVAVSVKNVSATRPIQFENELMVALSKQTCSSGACHGSPSGKGGFRLSLRASDKDLDALTLVREEFGRRINPLEPDASLLLRKPLMQLPHGGGVQLALDDDAYDVIRAWIADGAKVDPAGTPRCVRLEVSPGGRQVQRLAEGGRQIVATAHFTDGTRRDVSHLVAYESSAPAVATVDARGWVSPRRKGEAVILVRFLEHISLVPLMFVEHAPGFVWRAPAAQNEIDHLVDDKLRALDYPPGGVCTDSEFVRRVHLDVVGLLPTAAETEAFLADSSADKRAALIDRLLDREDYARFAALKWGDILRLSRKRAGDQGVYKYHRWLEDAFRTNMPHDQFARELLLARGSSFSSPATHFFRTTVDTNETVETVTQLFLGVRFQCAKCHNHPFDRWTQDNYHGLSAFFDRVRKRPTPLPDEMFVFLASEGDAKHPRTGRPPTPWLPFTGELDAPAGVDCREPFVDWLLAHDNPFFARVEANRIWSQFFARGIVHPVDEFRDSNPPSNGPLLDWLAAEFIRSGFDRKHLIRTILRSRTYQATSTATADNRPDTLYFSHQLPRLLSAEQLLDGIGRVVGVEQRFGPLPAGVKATALPAPDIAPVDFLRMLGQPDRGTVCACERTEDSNLGMAIELFNGRLVMTTLANPGSRFRTALAAGTPVEGVIRGLYLAALCREPSADELAAALNQAEKARDPAAGIEDVCWAIINSDEFVFQH